MNSQANEVDSSDHFRGGAGEPLVLLHGATSSWRCWRDVIPRLTDRYDVFAPNLPGHAGLPRPTSPHTVRDLADVLERQMDSAGFETAHLAGNSLGGWLAVELAARGRARTAVALSPAGGWHLGETSVVKHFYSMRRGARAALLVPPWALRSRKVRQLALRRACEHGDRLTPRQILGSAKAARACVLNDFQGLAGGIESQRFADVSVPGIDEVAFHPAWHELMTVAVRAGLTAEPWTQPAESGAHVRRAAGFIAWSENDRVVPADRYTERWREEVPAATWSTLPDVGHCPMYDDPALVAETIRAWAAQTGP